MVGFGLRALVRWGMLILIVFGIRGTFWQGYLIASKWCLDRTWFRIIRYSCFCQESCREQWFSSIYCNIRTLEIGKVYESNVDRWRGSFFVPEISFFLVSPYLDFRAMPYWYLAYSGVYIDAWNHVDWFTLRCSSLTSWDRLFPTDCYPWL